MSFLLRLLLQVRILSPALRPLVRLIVGFIAVPLFRKLLTRVYRKEDLDRELIKDIEQWFRGSLLLLVASANMENALFGWVDADGDYAWVFKSLRVLLAVGVIEAMPDQELFAIIHPGPSLLLPKGRRLQALREQWWGFCKAVLWRHLDRSSAVFAIMTAMQTGWGGWVCYGLAVVQYLAIGLICSRDKAIDALEQFDHLMLLRREQLFPTEVSQGGAANAVHPPLPGEHASGLPNPPP